MIKNIGIIGVISPIMIISNDPINNSKLAIITNNTYDPFYKMRG